MNANTEHTARLETLRTAYEAEVAKANAAYQASIVEAAKLQAREQKKLEAARCTVEIPFANVTHVYSGHAHKCMCGCAGKYSYASAHVDWSGKRRGYEVDADDVSDRSVKTILKKVNAHLDIAEFGADYVCVEQGNRVLLVGFKA